jgi:hypothetical protein
MPDFSDFIVYADESGDHGLVSIDPQFPVFALTFCVMRKATQARRHQMLSLSPCGGMKNTKAPEAPEPLCRPGNSQSFDRSITTKSLSDKLIHRREHCS